MALHENQERLAGIVERVTYHNEQNGWSVLKVNSFRDHGRLTTVLIHQAQVFAGATMEFWGTWVRHPKHGEQFKATSAVEKKPATSAALEKYLGSGLIKGVGPAIAKRIVGHFKDKTLDVFENNLEKLLGVPGIAEKKLEKIKVSWIEHRAIRDVMIFLQGYGISTLFSTKIYKSYGDKAIEIVSKNPYRLAHDIYGIGFFSADRIALAMGFERDGVARIGAGIKHVLAASREAGHCYLTEKQILSETPELLRETIPADRIENILKALLENGEIKARDLKTERGLERCYYSKGLYYDELNTAKLVSELAKTKINVDHARVASWVKKFCEQNSIVLSDEQFEAVCGIPGLGFSVLTGGPGCGKTTTTRVLVQLLLAMKRRVLLAAPTGRAAQRMSEVIGVKAKTIHRLLEWAPHKGGFKKDEHEVLDCDTLIVDECSMLDVSLAASLLKAVPKGAQLLFIGDPDQLPAVGAGDVLADLLKCSEIARFKLTKVFRQAQASSIIRFAHEINRGQVPKILSPLANTAAFSEGHDCLFVDADEATQEQIKFIQRAKGFLRGQKLYLGGEMSGESETRSELESYYYPEICDEASVKEPALVVPEKFRHVDLEKLLESKSAEEDLLLVLKNVHPWSSLHYGLNAAQTVLRLYTKTIPKWLGSNAEIQVLSPQVRGSLGTLNLNTLLQSVSNPEHGEKKQIVMGDKILRVGDRVIQTRNNYDLGVFNGDIGRVTNIDLSEMSCEVHFLGAEERRVVFKKDDLTELSLAYSITIHKSQGSEFQAVIIPVLGQHYNMLFRNLIYTGLTRAKKLAVFVGTRRAFALAVGQVDNRKPQTALAGLI